MSVITSRQNEVFKSLRRLVEDKRERKDRQLFWTDGVNFVFQALENNWQIEKLVIVPEMVDSDFKKSIVDQVDEKNTIQLTKELYSILATKELHQGIGAIIKMKEDELTNQLTVVLESPRSLGNLGTIMRTMVGFEILQLIIIEPSADFYAPEVVRASMGGVFHLQHRMMKNTDEALRWCKEQGLKVMAFALDPTSTPLKKVNKKLNQQDQIAIWFGNEAHGLSEEVVRSADKIIRIESGKRIDSLNLSESVGIGLYTLLDL